MIIQTSKSFPPVLKKLSSPPQPPGEIIPGFITGVDQMLEKRAELYQSIARMSLTGSNPPPSFLVVKPEQVPEIFDTKTLSSIKTIASQIAKEIHPVLKFGIDAMWLGYSVNKLRKDWKKPDFDTGTFLFEAAGVGLGALSLANSINSEYKLSEYKISDETSYGLDVFVKSGKAIYQNKSLPINEILLSKDKNNKIPIALLKLAGIALDPEIPSVAAVPLTLPKEKSENSTEGKAKSK
ncbi:MAG: hypothetical protein M3384_00205 [Acidobacteriota bacterium]|nr:hypothetical protein [Acidobacteriota bacterium]